MKMKNRITYILSFLIALTAIGCTPLIEDDYADADLFTDSGMNVSVTSFVDTGSFVVANTAEIISYPSRSNIDTKAVLPGSVLDFARSLIGTPYRFASSDPGSGFDCSGFITYVFQHFDVAVPRSSKDFENIGTNISQQEALPGDLILFTGTDHNEKLVGHMGIITSNNADNLSFIHSTSGKSNGVTISPLNDYYQSRFVKVIRIFDENNLSSLNH